MNSENFWFDKEQIFESQVHRQKTINRLKFIRYFFIDSGIRTNMPRRNEEELKKVTQLVKEKNYNHRELAVLKQEDLIRMKETIRKPTKEEEALEKKMA